MVGVACGFGIDWQNRQVIAYYNTVVDELREQRKAVGYEEHKGAQRDEQRAKVGMGA